MGIVELLVMLAIGAVAGWLAGNLMRGGGFGLIGNIITGLVGSVVGTFVGGMVSPALGLNFSGLVGTLIWATVGAVIVLLIISGSLGIPVVNHNM